MKISTIIPAIAAALTLATPAVAGGNDRSDRRDRPSVSRHDGNRHGAVHRGHRVTYRSRPVAYRGHYGHRNHYGYGYGYRGYYGRPVIGVRPIPLIHGIAHAIFGHPGRGVYRGGHVF